MRGIDACVCAQDLQGGKRSPTTHKDLATGGTHWSPKARREVEVLAKQLPLVLCFCLARDARHSCRAIDAKFANNGTLIASEPALEVLLPSLQ